MSKTPRPTWFYCSWLPVKKLRQTLLDFAAAQSRTSSGKQLTGLEKGPRMHQKSNIWSLNEKFFPGGAQCRWVPYPFDLRAYSARPWPLPFTNPGSATAGIQFQPIGRHPSINVGDTRQQATGGRDLVACSTANVGLQIIRIGMDADFVLRCNVNDIRGVMLCFLLLLRLL